jgi:acyl-CoA thioesterase I
VTSMPTRWLPCVLGLLLLAGVVQAQAPATVTLTVIHGTFHDQTGQVVTGAAIFAVGARVVITADDPGPGKAFDRWTGDIAGIRDLAATRITYTVPPTDCTLTATFKDSNAVRVACLGDTITTNTHYPRALGTLLSTPYELSRYLAPAYDVREFAVADATIVDSRKPYRTQPACAQALAFQPQIVVIMLGTQDSQRGANYDKIGTFVSEYEKLVGDFTALPSAPKVYVCLPPPIFGESSSGLTNANLEAGVITGIRKVASDLHLPIIDINTPLQAQSQLFFDHAYPTGGAASIIAPAVFTGITGCQPPATLLRAPTTPAGDNLLTNPGAEDGATAWSAAQGTCSIVADPAHGGTHAFQLAGQPGTTLTLSADITAALTAPGPGDYYLQGYTRLVTPVPDDASVTGVLQVMIVDERGQSTLTTIDRMPVGAADWATLRAIKTLSWTGALQSAHLILTSTAPVAFYADDFSLVKYPYAPPANAVAAP